MAIPNKLREDMAQKFIESLSQERLPWSYCWQQTRPVNATNGKQYRGVNALYLSYYAHELGYRDPRWCTFNQAQEKGWSVRKGEKACRVEYWAYYDTKKKQLLKWSEVRLLLKADPEYERNLQLRCRVYAVFNAQQIDGIPELAKEQNQTDIGELRQQRDILIRNMGVGYQEMGDRAYYSPEDDMVVLPPEAAFDDTYSYMSTLLHECGHATGHASRLDRDMSGKFGNESYAREELRAEIASAFTAQALGLQLTSEQLEAYQQRHMAYVQNWAQVVKSAPEELFRAIKDAEKISDYLIEKGEFQPIIDRVQVKAEEQEYYHFYYQCKYQFTAAGKEAADKVLHELSVAFNGCGWFWSDSGDVMKSNTKEAAPTIYYDADPNEPKVYTAATPYRIQAHLEATCYHWQKEQQALLQHLSEPEEDRYADSGHSWAEQAQTLPTGWVWERYDDGSGHLRSPECQRYFSYDTQPYPHGIEYRRTDKDLWGPHWGSFEEFREFAEKDIRAELERDQLRESQVEQEEVRQHEPEYELEL